MANRSVNIFCVPMACTCKTPIRLGDCVEEVTDETFAPKFYGIALEDTPTDSQTTKILIYAWAVPTTSYVPEVTPSQKFFEVIENFIVDSM